MKNRRIVTLTQPSGHYHPEPGPILDLNANGYLQLQQQATPTVSKGIPKIGNCKPP